MHQHILIPTDGSELSQNAVEYGIALAKAVNAKVTVLTVTPPYRAMAVEPARLPETPEQHRSRMEAAASKSLSAAKDAATAAGRTCDMVHVEHDQPYVAILDAAAQHQCDLIVMASHGRRGISAFVLGSQTVKVLTHSTIPVLVLRAPPDSLYFAAS